MSETQSVKPTMTLEETKKFPWYHSTIGSSLNPAGRELLVKYAGIPESEVESHIFKVRDSAWKILQWPCIGEFWFVSLGLSMHKDYEKFLDRLRSTSPPLKLLDLGTCMGQDLRKLAFDGAPLDSLYGSDLYIDFERVGFELFKDEDRFKNKFYAANVLNDDNELAKTRGTWDIINIIMFLHIWDWDTQVNVCKRILKLLRNQSGSMVIGAQSGEKNAKEVNIKSPLDNSERKVFRQSKETFTQMWEKVGEDEGVKFNIDVEYDEKANERRLKKEKEEGAGNFWSGDETRRMFFTIEIV